MVEEVEFEGREAYTCECCGFHYRNKDQARKCEKHCLKNHRCDTKITGKSIERSE